MLFLQVSNPRLVILSVSFDAFVGTFQFLQLCSEKSDTVALSKRRLTSSTLQLQPSSHDTVQLVASKWRQSEEIQALAVVHRGAAPLPVGFARAGCDEGIH